MWILLASPIKKGKSAIYSSIRKYGLSNFKLEILEYCEGPTKSLIKIEQRWIDLLLPPYNLLKVAGSCLGRKCREETRV